MGSTTSFLKKSPELSIQSPIITETENEEVKHMKAYVKQLLKNKINNKYIPDFIEEKLYEELLIQLLLHLKLVLSETKIEFMDHEIHLSLHPKEKLPNSS